ncbi:MAG TPA: hypothetical protein VI796_04885 [Candidatus Thermoplasmatota archaeon]|nr:hypothetical protein [Candidatus Thermoplasmatota archaeon]
MVKDGNVRLDISISTDLERRLRASLHDQGMDKKGGISTAVSTAIEQWLAKTAAEASS